MENWTFSLILALTPGISGSRPRESAACLWWLTTLHHTSSAVAPKRARMPNSEGRETEPDTPSDEQHTRYSSDRDASGHYFFCENEQREGNDPNQVHDAAIEQEGH